MRQLLKKRLQDEKGLTLIELLAVVVILGIIAAIAIPSIGGLIQNTREDGLKADAIQVLNAAKTFVASGGLTENDGEETIAATKLAPYLEEVSLNSGYTVTVTTATDGSNTYKLNGSGTAGRITITFTNATIDSINKAADGATTIETK